MDEDDPYTLPDEDELDAILDSEGEYDLDDVGRLDDDDMVTP